MYVMLCYVMYFVSFYFKLYFVAIQHAKFSYDVYVKLCSHSFPLIAIWNCAVYISIV